MAKIRPKTGLWAELLGNYAIAGGLVALCSRFRLPGRIGGQVEEWSGCGGIDRVAGWSGARRY